MPRALRKIFGCPAISKNRFSDNKDKEKRGKSARITEIEKEYNGSASFNGESRNEDPDLEFMRRTIKEEPEIFILNNLMMCVQFFENYDEEINQIREMLVPRREMEFNSHLLPQKRALLPDVLQEHIAHNLKFTSTRHTTMRPTIEPLQPIRIYVVHENFEVTEQNNPHHYTTMNDTVTYNLWLRPCDQDETSGYVHLQHLDIMPSKTNATKEEELTSIAENSDELYNGNTCCVEQLQKATTFLNSSSSEMRFKSDLIDEKKELESERELKSLYYDKTTINLQNRELNSSRNLDQLSLRNARYQQARGMKQRFTNESPTSSISSGYVTNGVDSDSDYGYSGIRRISELLKNSELPKSCFKMFTYTLSGQVYDPAEERQQNLDSKQRRIKDKLYRHNYNVWYINSITFMRYFYKVFTQQLAVDSLGFDKESVDEAKCYGCVISCDKVDFFGLNSYVKFESYEIIPSVWSQWPSCVEEWIDRPRSTWPNFQVIEKIKEFGCYVVPQWFTQKKETNHSRKIEWQLTFPAAERYLETCMSHAQTRVFLIALMLHKTFMRPTDKRIGLNTSHIRNKLFWLIEQNEKPSDWPEHRTGECLLSLLNSLYYSISQNAPLMRDYFMKEKNLLQNIPNECLLQSQKQLKRILDNPVMYVFHAMENIQHKQNFFPRLDYEELLRILTVDIVSLVHPQLAQSALTPYNTNNSNYTVEHDIRNTSFWDNSTKDTTIPRKPSKVTNRTLINSSNPRNNSIVEISVRCAELDDTRLSKLLDFFIRHFIQIAKRYHQYGASQQKAIYIEQAERLCILLSEKERCQEEARIYRQKLRSLENLVVRSHSQKEPPETPKRNIDAPFFSRPLKDRFSTTFSDQFTLEKVPETRNNHDNRVEKSNNVKITTAIVHENKTIDTERKNGDSVEIIQLQSSRKKRAEGIHRRVSIVEAEEGSVCEITRI